MIPRMYCITCREIPWRRDVVAERFSAQNMDVTLFEGIHGPTLGLVPRLAHYDTRDHYMTSGYVGLHLSNLLLWYLCWERQDDPILIFEDDVQVVPNFMEELQQAIQALPQDWDICFVGHCCAEGKPTTIINERVSEIHGIMCNHAMLYRRRVLPRLIEAFQHHGCNSHSDIQSSLLVHPQVRTYAFTPPLAFQDCRSSEASSPLTWESIPGWFDFGRLYDEALDRVVAGREACFVEVGAFLGKSTAYMAEEIKRRCKRVKFYVVDPWDQKLMEAECSGMLPLGCMDIAGQFKVNMSQAGVLEFVKPLMMTSEQASRGFFSDSVDFCFIDGDHAKASVLKDLEVWLPRMKATGVMAGHDYDLESVRSAVQEVFGKNFRTWERCWIHEMP